jgi:hypothetical protein
MVAAVSGGGVARRVRSRSEVRVFTWLLACGGKGDDPSTPDDSDTDTDSDTDSDTDTDTDTDSATHSSVSSHSGRYWDDVYWYGTIHVEVADGGLVVNNDACDTDLFGTTDPDATPAFQAEATCTFAGLLAGQTFTLRLEGDGVALTGDAYGEWPSAPYPLPGTWLMTLDSPGYYSGRSEGMWRPGGSQTFDWVATWDVYTSYPY